MRAARGAQSQTYQVTPFNKQLARHKDLESGCSEAPAAHDSKVTISAAPDRRLDCGMQCFKLE